MRINSNMSKNSNSIMSKCVHGEKCKEIAEYWDLRGDNQTWDDYCKDCKIHLKRLESQNVKAG